MKNLYTFLLLFLAFAGTLSAQTLKGHVYDAKTNEPLPGVNISYSNNVKDALQGTTSDINGYYELILPAGGVELTFSYIGYETHLLPVVINNREVMTQDVYLKDKSNMMDEVVVSVGRFEQKLSDITVSMDLLKASDIAKQAPTDLSATLKTLPGVDVTDRQPSIRGGSGWTYGVGARSLILVDGMSALTPGNGEINWNTIPMENVEQVEVLKGASSVLYGSSALNGLINIRTARPGLVPTTHVNTYLGIYGNPDNESYEWSDKSFWKEGKYDIEPFLRKNVLSGIRNPIYEGVDFTHSRRIGNWDVSGGLNLFSDEGYRMHDFNKRLRVGGNLTYHDPYATGLNYGFNVNFLSNQYGDFFIWRSPAEAYTPSPLTNMGREGNVFYLDPFFNYTNEKKHTTHRLKGRFYYKSDKVTSRPEDKSILEIASNMGTDVDKLADVIANPGSYLLPLAGPAFNGDLKGTVDGLVGLGQQIFPTAGTADYMDLLAWGMNHSNNFPLTSEGKIDGSKLIPWLNDVVSPEGEKIKPDNTYSYYLDYQFSKRWGNAQLTTGATYEHVRVNSALTDSHDSDNAALFFQYDDNFFDRLNLSLGVRFEYYRIDSHYKEAKTKIFGTNIPVKPVFRGGLNYKLAEATFLRASFGQGYRYPSITEKYIYKNIGGVAAYPNNSLKAETGYNAEIGVKQGYKFGNLKGFFDAAAFYTRYKDMIEFRFGLFDKASMSAIGSLPQAVDNILAGRFPEIGAQFYNVEKARIYGVDVSTSGMYEFNPTMKLTYNLGYVFIEPEDMNYKKQNAEEATYTDPLQMKTKSNTSKYLKYRQKHTVKGVFDFQWKRLNIGTNMSWKSKTLAVDYLMVDEREKYGNPEVMDYVRSLLFGTTADGYDLNRYWKDNNKGYFVMDLRAGVKVTNNVQIQFLINNLLNKEYCVRPMAVSAPRTYVMQLNMTF